jgi:hypothetical protein
MFPEIKCQHPQRIADLCCLCVSARFCSMFECSCPECPQNLQVLDEMGRNLNPLVEFQNEESRNPAVMRSSNLAIPEKTPARFWLFSIIIFRVEKAGSAGAAHIACRRQIRRWLLQIQRVSNGEPPTPSASDLTLELDQY